jgi:alanyl-tRNA synthetase
MVNAQIANGLSVETRIMSIEDAKKSGAMALFGEKYGDTVRVVSMGDFSVELCGGTHVNNTGAISIFKIISESGIAAGVRRIEALTGQAVFHYYEERERILEEAARAAKSHPAALKEKIEGYLAEIKKLQSENESLKSKAAREAMGDVTDRIQEIAGVRFLAVKVSGVDMNGLMDLGDQLKTRLGEGVLLLISDLAGKVNLMAMATDSAIDRGAHAGNLIKGIVGLVGGGGGGRPAMAQAGGRNPAGIEQALREAAVVLGGQIQM